MDTIKKILKHLRGTYRTTIARPSGVVVDIDIDAGHQVELYERELILGAVMASPFERVAGTLAAARKQHMAEAAAARERGRRGLLPVDRMRAAVRLAEIRRDYED
jgi:hypothetical protein